MAPVIPANNMGPQKVIPVILDEGICGAAAAPRNALELLDDFGEFCMMSREKKYYIYYMI